MEYEIIVTDSTGATATLAPSSRKLEQCGSPLPYSFALQNIRDNGLNQKKKTLQCPEMS